MTQPGIVFILFPSCIVPVTQRVGSSGVMRLTPQLSPDLGIVVCFWQCSVRIYGPQTSSSDSTAQKHKNKKITPNLV